MQPKYHTICLIILIVLMSQVRKVSATETITPQAETLLTPSQLISDVLTANPQLEVAQATWKASVARIDQQASFDDPMLSYTMAPLTIGNGQTDYGQRIEISQKLPWPGKLGLRNEMASHKAEAVRETINGLRLKLSATARSLFADWYYIDQAMRINQYNQTLLTEFHAIALSRYSTGLASKQDALRAAMEFALLEHRAIVLKREQRSIRTRINTLLNKQPDSRLASPAALGQVSALPAVELLYEQALYARPELKVLAASLAAAKSQSELAIRENYPDISLKAGYNSLWENSSKHFTVGIGFNLPLFQAKHRAAENEALAQIKQSEWQKVDFIARLREEIQISYDRVDESVHVLNLYQRKLLPLAEETLEAAKADYQSGKGDFLNLISSEKNYMQTQLQVEQALADTHRRLAELESAIGHIQPLSVNNTLVSTVQ